MPDDIIKQISELRDLFDEYFTKLAEGEEDVKPPLEELEELPEPEDITSQLEVVVADTVSEENEDPEGVAYDTMKSIDNAVKMYNLLRRVQEDRITALTTARNNENPNAEEEDSE